MTLKFKKNKNYQQLCDQFHAWLVSDLQGYGILHVDGFTFNQDSNRLAICSANADWAIHCQQFVEAQPWLGTSSELCVLPTTAPLSASWQRFGGEGQSVLWAYGDHIFHLVFKQVMDAMVWASAIKRSFSVIGSVFFHGINAILKCYRCP